MDSVNPTQTDYEESRIKSEKNQAFWFYFRFGGLSLNGRLSVSNLQTILTIL